MYKIKSVISLTGIVIAVCLMSCQQTAASQSHYLGDNEENANETIAAMELSKEDSLIKQEDNSTSKIFVQTNSYGMDIITINGKEHYAISTEEQLRSIETYGLDKSYMQQNDITISDEEWIPIGTDENPFTGSYTGNGFKIIGLTDKDSDTALFGSANGASMYNITFAKGNMIHAINKVENLVCENAEECLIYDIFFE